MDLEQAKILLERYNQGICTPEEAKLVEQWFDSIHQHPSTGLSETETQHQLDDIKSRIDQQIAPPRPISRLKRSYALPAIAAMLLVVAGIFWYSQRKQLPTTGGPIVQITVPVRATHTTRDGLVEITTPRTVKDTIRLQDGSTIVLNAGSQLRYPEKFSGTERSIWLEEGEAFFDVAHDPAHPFVVHTGPLTTTALGTTFNIRTYATENKVTVALFTGKVKIDHLNPAGNKASSMILLPSEQVRFDRRQLSLSKSSFAKPEEVAAWKKGYLYFKDAAFNELSNNIENHFGVTVINQSNKTAWNYTGTFRNESLNDVMKTICLATSLSYTIKTDTVYLVNKN